ncbi:hypothetical protein [Sphingomonas sp. PAMC 26605]|uniref:hypothetical protein n=1 Tax=Sphingomonas sp. PAMC 26605 TaxID=1112214 RepID=UPI000497B2B2|nr:hypothetical protein [Sphingomonas sp. PAMC 26605]
MSMFGNPKPTASLSSTLLARKGMAKPAMRPQGFGGFGAIPGAHDDLGWNDMGGDLPPAAPVPPVLVQREVLREEYAQHFAAAEPIVEPSPVAAAPEPTRVAIKPVSVATATRIGRETSKKHNKARPKSAFTLRLDEERHLRLRLASALHNASAQSLVTEALDQFLQTLPEVDDLVRQLPTRTKR